jgi:type I restriction enzyme S subunit
MFGDPVTNPKAWKIEKLTDIATIVMGQSPEGDKYNNDGVGTPLLNGPTEFGLRHPKEKQWTTQPTKLCKAGDILFCVRGATAGRMNWAGKDYCIGRGLAAIRSEGSNEFVYAFLQFNYQHFQSIGQGSTFINISKETISNLSIPFPPVGLRRKFTALVAKVELLRAKQRESEKELDNLFNGLMQKAFRGELVG